MHWRKVDVWIYVRASALPQSSADSAVARHRAVGGRPTLPHATTGTTQPPLGSRTIADRFQPTLRRHAYHFDSLNPHGVVPNPFASPSMVSGPTFLRRDAGHVSPPMGGSPIYGYHHPGPSWVWHGER